MKSIVVGPLKYGIGLGFLAFIYFKYWEGKPLADGTISLGLKDILERPLSWHMLILALMVLAWAQFLTALRWYYLVRSVGLPFSLYQALRLALVGYFYSAFLPGGVSGDLIKAVGIAREQSRRTIAVSTVIVDRLIGLWAVFWLIALLGDLYQILGVSLVRDQIVIRDMVWWANAIVLGSSAVYLLLVLLPQKRIDRFGQRLSHVPVVGNHLTEVWNAFGLYRRKVNVIAISIGISLIGHASGAVVFHLASQFYEVPDPANERGTFIQHLLMVPVGNAGQALMPTPGGVGGGEAFFGYLYHLLNKPEVNGIANSLAQRFVTWILCLIGYLIYLQMRVQAHSAKVPALVPNAASDLMENEIPEPPRLSSKVLS